MDQSKTRMLAEAGVAIAIAQVLSFITIFHMPQGGSIKAAALVPLMIYAYRWGGARGIFAGEHNGTAHNSGDPAQYNTNNRTCNETRNRIFEVTTYTYGTISN